MRLRFSLKILFDAYNLNSMTELINFINISIDKIVTKINHKIIFL